MFRSKPRAPTELVRHTAQLLRFLAAENPEPCGAKREQKVILLVQLYILLESVLNS